jgi:hypothetical protein
MRGHARQLSEALLTSVEPSAPKVDGLRARIEALKRYDLNTNYRCGDSIDEMERADDGDWVRVEDVLALLVGEEPPAENGVTRFEVIDDTGRVLVMNPVTITLSYQDTGRTLKVFASSRVDPAPQTETP